MPPVTSKLRQRRNGENKRSGYQILKAGVRTNIIHCVLVTESSNLWCHVFHGATATVMYLWRQCMCYVISSEQNCEYRLAFGECLRVSDRETGRSRERCRTSTVKASMAPPLVTSSVAATSTGVRSVLPYRNKIWKIQIHHVDPSTKHPKGPRNSLSIHDGTVGYWLKIS